MEQPDWAPSNIDIERPSAARVYDYHLGGSHNFAVDRQVAERIATIMPELPLIARANRAFLHRAVHLLLDAGVRQFLDLGSGMPTVGNVHEIAQKADPDARVVYVDVDPVAVGHSRLLLAGNDHAAVVQADLRDMPIVLAAPDLRRLIDFAEPVGLLMVAVLHFVPDCDKPVAVVGRYRAAVPSGSYLVISHAAAPKHDRSSAGAGAASAVYSPSVAETTLRTRDQVAAMFTGCDLVEPGVVYVEQWHPDEREKVGADPQRLAQLVGVARKP